MSLTVVITGAGGFVGRRLAVDLARRGATVWALTSGPTGYFQAKGIRAIRCTWTEGGIQAAASAAGKADLWVHAAALIDCQQPALALYRCNALLAETVARAVLRSGARLLYISSVSVYGPGQRLSAEVAPEPATDYGLSKLLGERLCLAVLKERCWVLRLAGVWGREERPKLYINRCLLAAAAGQQLVLDGPGTGRRNYLWVGDMAGLVEAGFQENWYGVHLAAGPEPRSMREMVSAIAAQYGVPVIFRNSQTGPERDILVEVAPGIRTTGFEQALQEEAIFRE